MSIYLGLNERVKEFDSKHGGEPVVVGHWLLFPDGAQREANPMGAWIDPPPKPYERAQLIVRYHEERLRRATQTFDELKETLRRQASEAIRQAGAPTPPQPPGEAQLAELRVMQETVFERGKARDEAVAAAEQLKPLKYREREANAAVNAAAGQAALEAISSIKV